jgi:hypothetical protein
VGGRNGEAFGGTEGEASGLFGQNGAKGKTKTRPSRQYVRPTH